MSFTEVKNVRIKSLTPGAVVQLRLGKAAVKSNDDVVISAKLLSHGEEGEKSVAVFEETDDQGTATTTTISRFPGAAWRSGDQYVSLIAVDQSTFTIVKAASPIKTDAIDEAIALIDKERDDVYGADQLIAVFKEVRDGKRINTEVKSLIIQLANAYVAELSSLTDPETAA